MPFAVYGALHKSIEKEIIKHRENNDEDYVAFDPADYVDNPVALARYKAGITQEDLAGRLKVSQAYVSKVEGQKQVSPKTMLKVMTALSGSKARSTKRLKNN